MRDRCRRVGDSAGADVKDVEVNPARPIPVPGSVRRMVAPKEIELKFCEYLSKVDVCNGNLSSGWKSTFSS